MDQLRRTLALCRENGVRTYLLGNGSNTLFADEGYDGAVIDLRGLNFGPTAEPQPDGSTHLTAGAGLTLGRLCAVAQQQGLDLLQLRLAADALDPGAPLGQQLFQFFLHMV